MTDLPEATPVLSSPEPLDHPAEGVPQVVVEESGLDAAAAAIAAGEGPVAIDAERASGYRYGHRAYLIQLRREGAGTWLIDPVALPDLSPLNQAIGSAEWVLHAATQDLACLAEVGLTPVQLFDTELAGRLLGLPRVGLAAVVENYLGLSLAKEHSAVDWSTRPLPEPWLRYAALDVEVLIELRNLMGADLWRTGKAAWASEEFDALLRWHPPVRPDPWRRTSGINKVRSRRGLAAVRELWDERDRIAQDRDSTPARVLPDLALVEIAISEAATPDELPTSNRAIARYARRWLAAVARAEALGEDDLPPRTLGLAGPPPAKAWKDKDPAAAAHLAAVRQALAQFSTDHMIPAENVCSPEPMRRVIWEIHSGDLDCEPEAIGQALAALGVRRWQREIVAPMIVRTSKDV